MKEILDNFKSTFYYSFMVWGIYLYFIVYHLFMHKSMTLLSWILIAVLIFFAKFIQADSEVQKRREKAMNTIEFLSHLSHLNPSKF